MKSISMIGSEGFLAQNLITFLKSQKNCPKLFLYDYKSSHSTKSDSYKQIDFSNIESVSTINFDVDVMFVFIGRTGNVNGFVEYDKFLDVNEKFFLNILTAYVKSNSHARIIYPGSRLIFKSSNTEVDENSDLNPKSIYAVTKLACEYYLKIYKECFGIDYVILRICTPFDSIIENKGNYGTFEIFYNQAVKTGVIKVFGDGMQRKTYTHMYDICVAFNKLITANYVKYSDYNLGGQALVINDIAESIAKKYNAKVEHVPWEGMYEAVDGGSVVFNSNRFDEEFCMTYRNVICDIGDLHGI